MHVDKNARIVLALLVVATALSTGCGAQPTREPVEIEEEVGITGEAEEEGAAAAPPESKAAPEDESEASDQTVEYASGARPYRANRLIIKNAELKLLVSDTDVAIDRTTQIAADYGGYIISSRIWYKKQQGENYKYATITLGVPVEQFEQVMRRLRDLAVRVKDETASGQDVTDEYVDLQSRLQNLEATRDRIREFLDQAESVEESLRVNKELAAIEEQIEKVKGRMNYLSDRAAYSTIAVQIDPDLPKPTPPPAPTPTPSQPWSPRQAVEEAGSTLGSILRVLVELAIWFGIVVVPLLAPPALIVWAVRRRIGQKES